MTLGDEGLLRDVVSSVVGAAGFDLEDLTVIAAGRRRLVRVAVDRDQGLDLDAAAEVSRQISAALDEQGDRVFGGAAYTLEVTSPGVGRPLTEPRHFRRAAGRLVSVTLADGAVLPARILRLDGDHLDVLTGPDGVTRQTLALRDIARAKVEVEFSAPPAAVAAILTEAGVLAAPSAPGPDEGEDAR
jgi:ribosome maturation factor RimP